MTVPPLQGKLARPRFRAHRNEVLPPLLVGLLAAVAAAPSVAWMAVGGFLSDDWAIWSGFESKGLIDGLSYNAFTAPARPGAALLYTLTYGVVGPNPLLQGLILGILNAGLVVSAYHLGRHVLPQRVVAPFLVVLALAPNHATTRLWPATSTHALALMAIFAGVTLLLRRHPVGAAALLCVSTVLHEGGIALSAAMVLTWCALHPAERWRNALVVIAPAVSTAVVMALASPKRSGSGPLPLNNIESFVPGQLGIGLWSTPLLARLGVVGVIVAVVVAVIRQLPSFRSDRIEHRLVLLGAVLAGAGAAPYAFLGTSFATSGFFDRSNLMASVGVALILAAVWSMLSARVPAFAALVAVVALTAFAWGQVEDVRAFATAAADGEAIIDALVAMPLDPSRQVLVLDGRDPGSTGVATFVYDGDLEAALLHRTDQHWQVLISENLVCSVGLHERSGLQIADWRAGTFGVARPDLVRDACEEWRSR